MDPDVDIYLIDTQSAVVGVEYDTCSYFFVMDPPLDEEAPMKERHVPPSPR
jgi:hypothetical protein